MIALVRVDNRLIHGQVVSTWISHVRAKRVVVASDEAASSNLVRAAMMLAMPPSVELDVVRLGDADWKKLGDSGERVLVVLRDVASAEAAFGAGLVASELNLGNVHYSEGRKAVTTSIFLSSEELRMLDKIANSGVKIDARAVPTDSGLGIDDIRSRLKAAT